MKSALLLFAALLFAPPAAAAPADPPVAESKLANSSVSVLVDPKLDDGRLVIKIAAQNRTVAPVAFGPGSISVSKPNGEVIALLPLQRLIDDVRVAAGERVQPGPSSAPTADAYATSDDAVRQGDHGPTINGYTGSSAVAPIAQLRGAQAAARPAKPTISKAEAEAQIAALNQAILQDTTIQPGKVAAGQVVSEKLKFRKGEDRTLHLRISVAGDEHGFTIAAPGD